MVILVLGRILHGYVVGCLKMFSSRCWKLLRLWLRRQRSRRHLLSVLVGHLLHRPVSQLVGFPNGQAERTDHKLPAGLLTCAIRARGGFVHRLERLSWHCEVCRKMCWLMRLRNRLHLLILLHLLWGEVRLHRRHSAIHCVCRLVLLLLLLRLRLLRLLLLADLLLQLYRILLLGESLGVTVVPSVERRNASALRCARHS